MSPAKYWPRCRGLNMFTFALERCMLVLLISCIMGIKYMYLMLMIQPWWRHQMETFSALLALCAGNSPVPVNSPHKGQWRGALMFSLICVWINDWVNSREAGDLRRQRSHYDVIVMLTHGCVWLLSRIDINANQYSHFLKAIEPVKRGKYTVST